MFYYINISCDDLCQWLHLFQVSGNRYDQTKNLAEAARLINGAKRPVIIAGQGILSGDAASELRAVAHFANVPVATTLQAKKLK